MPTYDVHVLAVVRVKVPGVKAPTLDKAIERALREVDLTCISVHNRPGIAAEYDSAIIGFVLDNKTVLHSAHTEWVEQHLLAGLPLWDAGTIIHLPPQETEHARTE